MTTLNIILTSILVLCSIVLIAAVLMQQTKSSGLGGAFAGDTQSFTARAQPGGQASEDHRCRRHYHRRTGDFDHDLGISGTLDFAREYAAGILPFLLEQKRGNL